MAGEEFTVAGSRLSAAEVPGEKRMPFPAGSAAMTGTTRGRRDDKGSGRSRLRGSGTMVRDSDLKPGHCRPARLALLVAATALSSALVVVLPSDTAEASHRTD